MDFAVRSAVTFVKRLPFPILAIGISLAVGLFVPTFLEWLDDSRIGGVERKLLYATITVLVVTLLVTLFWMWWAGNRKPSVDVEPDAGLRLQFKIKEILILTAIVAIALALANVIEYELAPTIILLGLVGICVQAAFFFDRKTQARLVCLMACMYLPFFWVIVYSTPFGHVSGMLSGLPSMPGLFPAILLRMVAQPIVGADTLFLVAGYMVTVELCFGLWMVRRGGFLASVFVVGALMASCLGSMILRALYLA